MAKTSLKEATKKAAVVEENPTPEVETLPAEGEASNALTVRPDATLANYTSDDEVQGELTQDDQERAYLSIVAKTGEMSNTFTPGDLVLNGEFVIGGPKNPVDLVPIMFEKLYQNDLHRDLKEFGKEVKSAVNVLDLGGIVEYRPSEDKTSRHFWKPIIKALFLVKKPEGVNPAAAMFFPFEVNGEDYGVIGYTARTKTAYNGIAIPLASVKRAGKSIRAKVYRLSTKGETWEDKSWIQPALRAIGETPAEILDFIKQNQN